MTFTIVSTAPEPSLGQNRLFQVLLGGYLVLWIVLAVSPIDRQDWLLKNILAMVSVTLLIVTYRRFQFSDLSYVLIILFMILHAIGAHYSSLHLFQSAIGILAAASDGPRSKSL